MKVGIMQPYFFPYIGYWQLINAVDKYIIFDDVNYIKRGWINRNYILYKGQAKRINLHIKNASQNKLIKETLIAETQEDRDSLLLILKESYRNAPYFESTYVLLEKIISFEECNLVNYLQNQIKCLCQHMDIKTELLLSSEIEKDNLLRGEDRILNICKALEAKCYINAIGGKQLYHQDKFKEQKMELKFLRSRSGKYKQFESFFVPNLSIIDVMMFNNIKGIKQMLTEFELED